MLPATEDERPQLSHLARRQDPIEQHQHVHVGMPTVVERWPPVGDLHGPNRPDVAQSPAQLLRLRTGHRQIHEPTREIEQRPQRITLPMGTRGREEQPRATFSEGHRRSLVDIPRPPLTDHRRAQRTAPDRPAPVDTRHMGNQGPSNRHHHPPGARRHHAEPSRLRLTQHPLGHFQVMTMVPRRKPLTWTCLGCSLTTKGGNLVAATMDHGKPFG